MHYIRKQQHIIMLAFVTLSALPTTLAYYPQPTIHDDANTLNIIQPMLALSSNNLVYNGIAPTSISLTWTELSNKLTASTELQMSMTSSNGPWSTVQVETSGPAAENHFVMNMPPRFSYWLRVVYHSVGGGIIQYSNVLHVNPPETSLLSSTTLSVGSVRLSWTNNALYRGALGFDSYTIHELINRTGSIRILVTISSKDNTSIIVSNLHPSTDYFFYATTIDKCTNCTHPASPSYNSNNLDLVMGKVIVNASVKYSPVDIGVTESFACFGGVGGHSYNYRWVFGDNSSQVVVQNPTHVYSKPGNMTVYCLTEDNETGDFGTATIILRVTNPPKVTTPAAQPGVVDLGMNVTFSTNVSDGSGRSSITWLLPDGCDSQNVTSVTCQPFSTGTFPVNVTMTDDNSAIATSSVLYFTVNRDPGIQAFDASPASLKLGEQTRIVVLADGGTGRLSYLYAGLPSGCTSINSNLVNCRPDKTGNYAVTVTVTDQFGQSDNDTLVLNVSPLGAPSTTTVSAGSQPLINGSVELGVIIGIVAAGSLAGMFLFRRRQA